MNILLKIVTYKVFIKTEWNQLDINWFSTIFKLNMWDLNPSIK